MTLRVYTAQYVAEKYRSSLAKIVINFTDDEG